MLRNSIAASSQFGVPDQTDAFFVGNNGQLQAQWAARLPFFVAQPAEMPANVGRAFGYDCRGSWKASASDPLRDGQRV